MRKGLLLAAMSVVVGACSNPAGSGDLSMWANLGKRCAQNSPAFSLPDESKKNLPPHDTLSMQARRAEFARQLPGGWGGHFYADGHHTIYLKDISQRDTVLTALTHLFEYGKEVRVLQGRWDFAQLYDWHRYLNDPIFGMEGVHGSTIDEARNRLLFVVDSEATRRRVSEELTHLNVPCFLVALEIAEPMRGF